MAALLPQRWFDEVEAELGRAEVFRVIATSVLVTALTITFAPGPRFYFLQGAHQKSGSSSDSPAVLVDVEEIDSRWQIDIRYATSDNFTGRVLYPTARCLLRPEVAQKLQRAQRYLDRHHPGYSFRLKDCYRPRSVQVAMWKVVRGTASQGYVANPHRGTGSVHNYGAAVDLTLNNKSGDEVDMGTPYDSFQNLAQPRYEDRFHRQGMLTDTQLQHRRMLRDAMRYGGFRPIRNEWWHFDAYQGEALRQRYSILDLPFDAVSD